MTAVILFWSTCALLGYIYVGYPLVAKALARRFGTAARRAKIRPKLSVVITAYNEERGIRTKLDNVASLDYPKELLEIIVASDASTDATDAIVAAYAPGRIRLLRVEGRVGKTACQNAAVEIAAGEIIVFTDATTRVDGGAAAALVENFADARIGCAAGLLVYEQRGTNLTAQGGVAYWSYELGLRQAESMLGSLVGVSGCLYAVRRTAYRPIAPSLISDFVIALQMHERGLRTVLERNALCFEETHDRPSDELAMRVRVAIRSINALVVERRLLNPFRHGRFAWQLWSHKVLRYASPFLWFGALASNIALARHLGYSLLLGGQGLVLALGVAGFALHSSGRQLGLLNKPYYFLLTNLASLIASIRYVAGERMVTWNPVR